MKIFFIQADQEGQARLVFPLGIAYVATMVETHGHQVVVFDPNVERNVRISLEMRLRAFNPDLVGISLRNIDSQQTQNLVYYLEFLRPQVELIKSIVPHAKLVVGGSGFSIFAEKIMEMFPEFDFGVYLEAEESFPELLAHLDHPELVKGVFYRKEGKVFFTDNRPMPNFADLPVPKRSFFTVEHYVIKGRASMGVQAKRGCPLNCAYCTYPFLNGKTIRMRDPVKVVDEIHELQDRWHFDKFMFVDAIFNIPMEHAEKICQEMIIRNLHIKWFAYFNEQYITENFVRLAVKAGCETFLFSPDGYSERTLQSLGKSISIAEINRVFRIIRKVRGAKIGVSFFQTAPGQSLWSFLRILLLYVRAKTTLGKRLVGFGLMPLRIEPGTKIFETAISEGICQADDDLIKPVFYQHRPARYIEKTLNVLLKVIQSNK